LCIEIDDQRHWQQAEQVNNGEEQRVVQLENERRAHVRLVVNQITNASTTQYIPSEKQVHCVTVDHYTVQEALTIVGDHHTPCRECLRNDPDKCFWILMSIGMNVLGRQVRTGRSLQNKQVQYFLYQSFVDEKYNYL